MGDIHFSGGNQNIGAVGQHAQGHISHAYGGPPAAGLDDLDRRIAELRELVDRYAAWIADPPAAREAVDEVAEEVRSGNARPGRVRLMLNAVAGAAPGVTAITQMVQELLRLVTPTPS
ncbi:DUF5955 family protein [Actinoplanes sp. NPDC024001]|uniref:DUF5955 family protein n=1 Tax=Actinoplanes sp. NPDC024001 TaxID=3154598 RepID=UPI0033C2B3D1